MTTTPCWDQIQAENVTRRGISWVSNMSKKPTHTCGKSSLTELESRAWGEAVIMEDFIKILCLCTNWSIPNLWLPTTNQSKSRWGDSAHTPHSRPESRGMVPCTIIQASQMFCTHLFFFIYTYICSRSIHFTYEKMTSWKLHGSIATSLNFRSNKYHYHSPLKKKNGPFWSHILIMIVSNLVRKLGLAMRANSLEHFRQPETVFLQESIQIYIIQAVPSQCCWHIKKLRSVNWN